MSLKVSIGFPTYNDFERASNLLASLTMFTPTDIDFKIVCLDDGTSDKEMVKNLQNVCDSYNVPLIKNEKNLGIPASWNILTKYYDDADIQVLFNDDICVNDENWLRCLVYIFENNDNIGSVGLNLIQVNPETGGRDKRYNEPTYNGVPGRVGSPVGCAFAFLRKNWKETMQPDGSVGFYESLKSFYEETDFGFSQWTRGLMSLHAPYPAVEHWGSMTFGKNHNLSITDFNDMLSKDEYMGILKQHPEYMSLPIEKHMEVAESGKAYRMDYARVMFAKKWLTGKIDDPDYWRTPQVQVHNDILKIEDIPRRKIKYLNCDMMERECEA